jgi:hypothetical protein
MESRRKGKYNPLPKDVVSTYNEHLEDIKLTERNTPDELTEKEKELLNHLSDNNKILEAYKEANAKASTSSGGNKKRDTYTVKELKTIASRNNIKTTKKLNGKTVPLNKKGLVAKLKRNKVI